jgi:apolipoprotein N-acyltransferase
MKHVMGYAAKIVFYVFCLVVLGWTATLTASFVQRVLPDSQVEPYLALAVFDGGAIAWLMTFLWGARGLGQRAVSILMLVLDLCGVALMTIAELFLGGQTFTEAPAGLGTLAVWAIGIWTFMNLAAAYAYHVLDPKAHEEITIGVAQDKVRESGIRQLEANLDALGAELAAEIGEELKVKALRQLGLRDRPVPAAMLREPAPVLDMRPAGSNGKYRRVEMEGLEKNGLGPGGLTGQ